MSGFWNCLGLVLLLLNVGSAIPLTDGIAPAINWLVAGLLFGSLVRELWP